MIEVYTDGGCRNNPGLGAWAYIIVKDNQTLHHQATVHASSAGVPIPTTNNEMELTAILKSLEYLEQRSGLEHLEPLDPITIFSDSQYSVNAITLWYPQWRAKGQLTTKKHIRLIESILRLKTPMITIKWLKGHSTNQFNNLADRLVNEAMNQATVPDGSAIGSIATVPAASPAGPKPQCG